MTPHKIGIVTASDRAARGEYVDRGGPAVDAFLKRVLNSPWEPHSRVVSDDISELRGALIELCDAVGCALVITTGGTGIAPRDHTPDVTLEVCETEVPGFGERMRAVSMPTVPTSILSRQTAGIRNRTLIVNVPGSPKAIDECLGAIFSAIPHALTLLGWDSMTTDSKVLRAEDVDHE